MAPAPERRVLLIIGGGIAAYKSLLLIRLCARAGIATRAVLTKAGAEFVTPLSVAALTGDKVYSELFNLTDEAEMGHIQLSRAADLVVVAPATADLIAKSANGHANDLASTLLLATDKPVMWAPAMNVRMWTHRAVQRNVETLLRDGAIMIGPEDGDMACGEFGPGRMAEPETILAAIEAFFKAGEGHRLPAPEVTPWLTEQPLAGRRMLVTAGPTLEAIDPVRFLSNRSSGKQGYAIAEALAELGAEVVLVSGPTALCDPKGVQTIRVESARDMLAACEQSLPMDAAFCVAAVADWRPARAPGRKIKKERDAPPPALALVENPDILAALSRPGKNRPALVVGFAAETNDIEAHARAKIARKGCDWILANDVSGDVMGGEENEILLIRADETEHWPRMPKAEAASRLAAAVAAHFGQTRK